MAGTTHHFDEEKSWNVGIPHCSFSIRSCSQSAQTIKNVFLPNLLSPLPTKKSVPDAVTCGLETVAVRMPAHPVARKLIELCDFPIAAPSANLSGRPSPTTAKHVMDDLNGKIEYVIDGGSTQVGLESTVVDLHSNPPLILRPGGVTLGLN